MRRNKKKKIITSLIGILILMTVGYAAFQTNLQIKGTSKINSNWNVLITNVTKSNVTGGAEETKAPTWDNLTAYMEADLYEKGDSIEYSVTVENRGTIDAALKNITENIKTTNEAVKITFSGYTKGEKLYKNTSKVIKVKIEYNPEFTGTPEEGSSETSITLDYTQAEGGLVTPTDKYLVTYNCTENGGKDCSSYNEYLNEGDTVNLTKTSEKEGYTFIGWNTNKEATEGLTSLQMLNQDIILYAIFKSIKPIIKSWYNGDTTYSLPSVANTEFHNEKYKDKIVSAKFLDNKNVPENAVISWDVSEASNKSVMAWLTPNQSDNTKYDLFIGGNGGVIANKESSCLFYNFLNLKTIDFGSNFDTSNSISMYYMFGNFPESSKGVLSEIKGLENMDTSKVTIMAGMFSNNNYTSLDLSNFDVSKVISTNSMFFNNHNLISIDLSNWKTDSLKNMNYMFSSCFSLQNLKINHFNTSNVYEMKSVFQRCYSLEELNLGSWATSNVTSMETMFYMEGDESKLKKINLCSFDTSKVTNMSNMFSFIKNLEKVYVGLKWTTSNAIISHMWDNSKISDVTKSNNCKIDAEDPAIINISTSKTTNSITVVLNASAESGIGKYEYSINGGNWITDKEFHIFNGLNKNTQYSIKVRVTSKVGKVTISDELSVTTNDLVIPTFEEIEQDTGGKKITITYPEGCGDKLTCSYKKDDDDWKETENSLADVSFDDSGYLVAKATDGTNTVSSSYTVIIKTDDIQYSGGVKEYTAEKDGYYKIELWGAQGAGAYNNNTNSPGAYTSGEIYLEKGQKLYIYIGQQGSNTDTCLTNPVFNGGSINDKNGNGVCGPTGGGATDVRLVGGTWNNITSLRSRIMVAAGGTYGAEGGDLIGRQAATSYQYYDYVGKMAKQTSGGVAPTKFSSATSNGTAGGFGFAGNGGASIATAGAGGGASGSSGYYGGSGASGLSSGVFYGGSGSSYISGYAGSNSIASASSGTHTNQTKHYSGKYFINTEMKSGINNGAGKANITYIKYPSKKDSEKIKGVRYIKDCTNGNNSNVGNHWIEIQAISNGENVAKGKKVSGLKGNTSANEYNSTTYAFSNAVDGMIDNFGGSNGFAFMGQNGEKNQCLIVDLGKEYNLEEIVIWHYFPMIFGDSDDRIYHDNITYVAGADGNYSRKTSLAENVETPIGKRIKEFK